MKGGGPITKIKTYVQPVSVKPTSTGSINCDLYYTADLINIQPALATVPTGNYLKLDPVTGGRIGAYNTSGQLCAMLDAADNYELLQCFSYGNRYKGRLRHDRSTVDVQKVR
jgi:hypothetical protein